MPVHMPRFRGFGLARFFSDLRHRRHRFRQALGIALVLLFTATGPSDPVLWWIGAPLALAGIAVRLWASGHIKKNRELATTGPYALVRHPLYVGNLLISIGFCLASGLWWSYPVMLLFWIVFYPPAVRYEDAKLHRMFGEPWEKWRRSTRALIPRLRPYGSAAGEWSFAYSMRLNAEPVIAVLLLAMLWWLYLRIAP